MPILGATKIHLIIDYNTDSAPYKFSEKTQAKERGLDKITKAELKIIQQRWLLNDIAKPWSIIKPVNLSTEERHWIANNRRVVISGAPDWGPIDFIDQHYIHQGLSAEYLAVISEKTGLQFINQGLNTWQQSLQKLESGVIDMIPAIIKTPKRQTMALFTAPYLSFPYVIATHKSFQPKSIKALENKLKFSAYEKQYISTRKVIRIHADLKAPFMTQQGTGILYDYMQLLSQYSQLSFQFIEHFNLADITVKPWSKQEVVLPLFASSLGIVTLNNVSYINHYAQLAGKKVLILQSNLPTLAKKMKNINITVVDDLERALIQVIQGEYYAVVGDILSMSYFIQKNNLSQLKISGLMEDKFYINLYTAPSSGVLNSILERSVQAISQVERNNILQKWMPLRVVKGVSFKVIALIVMISLFIIALIVLWLYQAKCKIKQHKLHQKQLLLAKKQAEEANLFKSQFVSNMSHELRTPINAILGFNHLLLHSQINSEQREYIEKSKLATQHLLTLVNDVLDYSIIETGQLKLQKIVFSLNDILTNLSHSVSSYPEIDICFIVPPDIPDKYCGDPMRLSQILLNLLNNACKFTPQGVVFLSINKRVTFTNRVNIEFIVKDSGVGIRHELLENLFRPFVQADCSSTRKFSGTGLGLTISQQIAKQMGGAISVNSDLGKGCEFIVSVWLDTVPDEAVNLSIITRRKILIYHENRIILESLKKLFMQYTSVVIAASEDTILTCIEKADFDLFLFHGQLNKDKILHNLSRSHHANVDIVFLDKGKQNIPYHLHVPYTMINLCKMLNNKNKFINLKTSNDRILIVDDNVLNCQVLKAMLDKQQYHCELAKDGEEAVSLVLNNQYHLILMDLQMPNMDGFEATQIIRAHYSPDRLPIIGLSADNQQKTIEQCYQVGMNDFLSKPVIPEQLFSLVEQKIGVNLRQQKQAMIKDKVLDVQAGLYMVGDDNAFYCELIAAFIKEHLQDDVLIKVALKDSNYKDAKCLIHTLGGISGNLGAHKLQQLCQVLEKNCQTEDLTTRDITALAQAYVAVAIKIEAYLILHQVEKKEVIAYDGNLYQDMVILDKQLGIGDSDSIQTMAQISGAMILKYGDAKTQRLVAKIEAFDFVEAKQLLGKILNETNNIDH